MHGESCELCGVNREASFRQAERSATILTDIRNFGYHKIGVFSEKGTNVSYSYTVGLFHSYEHPEVAVFGLEFDVEFAILDTINDLIANGKRFEHGGWSQEVLEGMPVRFLDFSRDLYPYYFGQSIDFYRSDHFPALTVTWPDKSGRFPWSDSSPDWLSQRQPKVWSEVPGTAWRSPD